MTRIIGIAGGTGSGKTTLAHALAAALGDMPAVIAQDWYYRDQRHLSREQRQRTNYDHPDAIETELLLADLDQLRVGVDIDAPQYDFTQHLRATETRRIEPCPIVIIEGLHVLSEAILRDMLELGVFLDVPADIRLIRRLKRDIAERGRSADGVIAQYLEQVRPMHEKYVAPSRKHADIVFKHPIDIQEAAMSLCGRIGGL